MTDFLMKYSVINVDLYEFNSNCWGTYDHDHGPCVLLYHSDTVRNKRGENTLEV
jgi:hypothetical protein